jgi:hypothetical protein
LRRPNNKTDKRQVLLDGVIHAPSEFFAEYHPHASTAEIEGAQRHDGAHLVDAGAAHHQGFVEMGMPFLFGQKFPVIIRDGGLFQKLVNG